MKPAEGNVCILVTNLPRDVWECMSKRFPAAMTKGTWNSLLGGKTWEITSEAYQRHASSCLGTAHASPRQALQGPSPKVVGFCIQNLQTFPNSSRAAWHGMGMACLSAQARDDGCPVEGKYPEFYSCYCLQSLGEHGAWGRWADEILVNRTYSQGCSWGRLFVGI